MSSAEDMFERHAAVLVELAEIGMVMARDLRDEVEAAETPEAKARAVAAYPRVARAVRQCLALEARFRRDAARDLVEQEGRVRREIDTHIRRRKAQVRIWMQRAICNETPDDDDTTEMRLEDLYERLDDQVLDEDFALQPFEDVIANLHRQLGLSPPTFSDGDDDPDDDDPDDEAAPEAGQAMSSPPEPPPPEPPPPEPDFHYSSG